MLQVLTVQPGEVAVPVLSQGIEIAFDVAGEGPAVGLGHSFLCSGAMWQNQVGPLAATNRVINVDLRGHGAFGRAPAAFSLYDLVADALAVLDHRVVKSAVW